MNRDENRVSALECAFRHLPPRQAPPPCVPPYFKNELMIFLL